MDFVVEMLSPVKIILVGVVLFYIPGAEKRMIERFRSLNLLIVTIPTRIYHEKEISIHLDQLGPTTSILNKQ